MTPIIQNVSKPCGIPVMIARYHNTCTSKETPRKNLHLVPFMCAERPPRLRHGGLSAHPKGWRRSAPRLRRTLSLASLGKDFDYPGLGALTGPPRLRHRGPVSAPKGIRTPDLPLRRRSLYPAELWVHMMRFFQCLSIMARTRRFVKREIVSFFLS